MNECTRPVQPCDTQATCTNTIGSYQCSCNPGFYGNGQTCLGMSLYFQISMNCKSSYKYRRNVVNKLRDWIFHCTHCIYIAENDECTEKTHDCHANASCTNTYGHFYCECYPGFFGSGRNCTGNKALHFIFILVT